MVIGLQIMQKKAQFLKEYLKGNSTVGITRKLARQAKKEKLKIWSSIEV